MSIGTALRGIPVVGPAITGPRLADAYDTHEEERRAYAKKLQEQAGTYSPEEAARYETAMSAPVDDAFSKAARGAAMAYGARGAPAPVASATMAGAAGQRGQIMQRVQQQAQDSARSALRQRTLDQYGAETGSWKQNNEGAMTAAQLAQAEDQATWDALIALGQEGIQSSKALDRERRREGRRAEYDDYLKRYKWASDVFDNPDNFG